MKDQDELKEISTPVDIEVEVIDPLQTPRKPRTVRISIDPLTKRRLSISTSSGSRISPTHNTALRASVLRHVLEAQHGSYISDGTEDDSRSFWTARGTIRGSHMTETTSPGKVESRLDMASAYSCDGTEASCSEIMLAWADESIDIANSPSQAISITPLRSSSYRIPIHDRSATTHTSGTIGSDETPMPSRVLYIFHPPEITSEPAFADTLSYSPLSLWNGATAGAEAAIWHLVLPPVEGIKGMGQVAWEGAVSLSTLFGLNR